MSVTGTITMAQMAKELGVSRNAVSAVVNGRARKLGLARSTEEKVRKYLEQRGYVQSKSAMQLRKGTAEDTIGILTCGSIAFYPHLTKALHNLSEFIKQKYGHVEMIGINPDKLQHGLREVVSQGINKLIWIHASAPEFEIINAYKLFPLLQHMKRVVIYNYDYSRDEWEEEYFKHGIKLVGVDRPACYQRVAEIFKKSGHSNVALDEVFIDHPARMVPNTNQLIEAFEKQGLAVHGLRNTIVATLEDSPQMTKQLIKLHKEQKVTCAFIRNDQRAVEIIGRLQEAGLKVPEDIAVIGFGNNPMTRWTSVPLTTFDFPVEEMCAETIRLINSNDSDEIKRSYFNTKLILRKSH